MPSFGTSGFIAPSHSHDFLSQIPAGGGALIFVGVDEVLSIGDLLERGQFTTRSIDENVIVLSELLEMGRVTVRNLFENIHLPADESFMLRSFTTASFTPLYSSGTFDTGTSFDSTSFFSSAPGGLLSGAFETPSFDSTSFEPFMGSVSVGPVPQLSRMTKKFRSIAEPIVSIGGAPAIIGYIVKTLSENVVISELLAIEAAIQKALTETVTITDTLTRISTKTRSFISVETVSISDVLTRAKSQARSLADSVGITEALTRLGTKARAFAESIGIGESVARSAIKTRSPGPPQIISISDALTTFKLKAKSITQTVTITDTLQMALDNLREIVETVSISELLQKAKMQTRPLTETLVISDLVARFRSKAKSISQTIGITDAVARLKPVVRTLTEVVTILEALTRTSTATLKTWVLSGQSADFPDKLDNMVADCITGRWMLTNPALADSPVVNAGSYTEPSYTTVSFITPTTSGLMFNNFQYDGYRTYYVRIKEGYSTVVSHRVRQRLVEFETPIELECTVRRLKKGEAFYELNNIINELMRILGTCEKEEIFGVQGISFDSITPLGNDRPDKTLWQRTLKVILHYYKADATEIPAT